MNVDRAIDGFLTEGGKVRRPWMPRGDSLPEGVDPNKWACRWRQCAAVPATQDALVRHLQFHTTASFSDSTMKCDWQGCPREGQSQATKSALTSHIRVHSGERPFVCPAPGCGKDFTRSDAMLKHLRLAHASTIATIQREAEPSTSSFLDTPVEPEPLISSFPLKKRAAESKRQSKGRNKPIDAELIEDEDLTDRIAPMRGRLPFWPTSEADLRTVEAIRKKYPHQQPIYIKGKIQVNDSDDEFDEGVAARYPGIPIVVDEIREEGAVAANVYSRPRWQVKYMMAKAKFMLVTEENTMRREELRALMKEEQDLLATTGGGLA